MLAGDATTSGFSKSTSSLGDEPTRLVHCDSKPAVVGAGDHPDPREFLADDAKGVVPAGVVDDDDIPSLQGAEALAHPWSGVVRDDHDGRTHRVAAA